MIVPLTVTIGRRGWSASWPMTALTALAIVLFVFLGRWQWQRAEFKRALDANFSRGSQVVIDIGTRASDALARYTQVSAQGRYDGSHQFLLDNISHNGQPGYEVLTPLLLADGRSVIVNRGWVPITSSRAQLPAVTLSAVEPLSVSGRLDQLPVAAIALGHVPPAAGQSWPKLTSFPTIADLSTALGRPLESRQILLNATEPFGYARDWQPAGLGVERHVSYAIQWWLFAALALVLYVYMNRVRARP